MRLRTLTILVGLSLGLLLVASLYLRNPQRAGTRSESGAVQVFFADNISPAHEAVIALFNKRHEGSIEVIAVNLPFDKFTTNERKELLARSLRSKSEKLDIFAVDLIWVPRFARWAEPLKPHIDSHVLGDILPTALRSCTWSDTLVALPMYLDVGLMYYRKDLIAALPDRADVERRILESISWDELLRLRKRLGYQDRPYYIYQAKEYEGLICNFLEIAVSHDPTFLENSTFALDHPAAQKALEQLVGLVRSGATPRAATKYDENESYRSFLESDAMFVRGWPNFIENFMTFSPDSGKLRSVGRAPLPHVKGSAPSSVFGGWNLMMSRSSSKKAEAARFIEFLQSEDAQRLLFQRGGYIPINSHIYEDSVLMRNHPELPFYHDLLERGFHRPAIVEYTKTSDVLSHYLNGAIEGTYSPRTALTEARTMIESEAVILK